MSENEKHSHAQSVGVESAVIDTSESGKDEDDFEKRLAGLPEKYRNEILYQYDIPDINVSLFAVLRHATLFEKLLMIIGTLSATASGIPLFPHSISGC